MITPRLVHLIEKHSEALAGGLIRRLESDERVADYRQIPREEIQQRIYEIYNNLSDWLIRRTEADIERRYVAIGERRAAQGISLSALVAAIEAVKQHLWTFLRDEARPENPVEVFGELELLGSVDLFFDRALYHAVRGYERAAGSETGRRALSAVPTEGRKTRA